MHFLNVGKGNCTVISFPSDRLSIVDIDNSHIDDDNDVLTDPIDFLNKEYPDKEIFRFILTHPDLDHMSGLNELFRRTVYNFWDTQHDKKLDSKNDDFANYNLKDWDRYLKVQKSQEKPTYLKLYRDATADCCWVADNIKILSPSKKLVDLSQETEEGNSDKYNHLSYVLRIEYQGIAIILGGDASKAAWDDIYDHYRAKNDLGILKAHVFLAPHHGSPNSVNESVFKYIKPEYVVVSVLRGVKYDYSYYNTLASKQVCSTKNHGNITIEITDKGEGKIYPEKNGS